MEDQLEFTQGCVWKYSVLSAPCVSFWEGGTCDGVTQRLSSLVIHVLNLVRDFLSFPSFIIRDIPPEFKGPHLLNVKLKQSFTSLLASTQCAANLTKEKQFKVETKLKLAQKTNHIL
jgi:hypothetical protein